MTDSEREDAIRSIRAKREFWMHAGIYVVINLALIGVWATTGAGYFWPGWVLLGWGIGLLSHAASVFFMTRPIREEHIQAEMAKRR